MIRKIDHMVLTTKQASSMIAFYQKLGFLAQDKGNRYELYAGDFKINVHLLGNELLPHARQIQPGSSDVCFEIQGSLADFSALLQQRGVEIEVPMVQRQGVDGPMKSIYVRDPDGNLVELSSYE